MPASLRLLALALVSCGFLLGSVRDTSSVKLTLPSSSTPHPEEIRLLDELAAWASAPPARSTPNWNLAKSDAHSLTPSAFDVFRRQSDPQARRRLVASMPFGEQILFVADRHELDSFLVAAVVETESSFDPVALSPRGAIGLMQLLPTTAAQYGVLDPHSPEHNLEAGARHLSLLLERFDQDLRLALAAYNAGAGAVRRYGNVPPYRETRRYVERVLRRYFNHHRSAMGREPSLSAVGQAAGG